jgi:acyl-CoA thioesterase-1
MLTNRRTLTLPCLVGLSIMIASCATESETAVSRPRNPTGKASADVVIDSDLPVILAFGDSLTAGHMVDADVSYPSQLQDELDRRGYRYRVVNQGVSGETTSGGLARLRNALTLEPELVILELGANDGLRGIPIEVARENLATMIEAFKEKDAVVVLAGLTLPRNYGPDYIGAFETMFAELAEEYDTALIPFFLEGVAGERELNLSDGIHPTGEGYAIVVDNVLKTIEAYLNK